MPIFSDLTFSRTPAVYRVDTPVNSFIVHSGRELDLMMESTLVTKYQPQQITIKIEHVKSNR